MAKYHISPKTGNPNLCKANYSCPFGGESEHYASKEEARAAYELQQQGLYSKTVGETAAFHSDDRVVMGKLVKTRGSSGVIEHDRTGWHYRVKLTENGWTEAPLRGKRDARIMNPGNHAYPTYDELKNELVVPEGFRLTEETEEVEWGETHTLKVLQLASDDTKIRVVFSEEGDENAYYVADGHVSFSSEKGWRSFDRRGIEDSFYVSNPLKQYRDEGSPAENLNATIKEFIEVKIPKSRERLSSSSTVPGTSLLITDDKRKKLISEGFVEVRPAGFGQGYRFSLTPSRWSKEATDEQKSFFGASSLWVENFDHD